MKPKVETSLPKQLYKKFFFVAFGLYIAAELVFYILGDSVFNSLKSLSGNDESSQLPPDLRLPMDLLWMAAKGSSSVRAWFGYCTGCLVAIFLRFSRQIGGPEKIEWFMQRVLTCQIMKLQISFLREKRCFSRSKNINLQPTASCERLRIISYELQKIIGVANGHLCSHGT
jgi:hypothetical protein